MNKQPTLPRSASRRYRRRNLLPPRECNECFAYGRHEPYCDKTK